MLLVFDCEVINPVHAPEDWRRFRYLGVSSVCVINLETGCPYIFMEDNIEECVDLLNSAELLVGFNNLEFDNPLLNNCWRAELAPNKTYDILHEFMLSANTNSFAGLSLDEFCAANLPSAYRKIGNGAEAPRLFQEAKFGNLLNYNMRDVFLTKLLFDLTQSPSPTDARGKLRPPYSLFDPRTGLSVKMPLLSELL